MTQRSSLDEIVLWINQSIDRAGQDRGEVVGWGGRPWSLLQTDTGVHSCHLATMAVRI